MTHPNKASEVFGIVRLLREGNYNDDELDNLLNRLAELYGEHDINLPHIPEDAGEHRAGIVEVLSRIPDGWGRWISCDAGWYPLITELGAKLAAIDPNYVVHQIKEKYGALRFYAETEAEGPRGERFDELIEAAQKRSEHICEQCGTSGAALRASREPLGLMKTLCAQCFDPSTSAGAK